MKFLVYEAKEYGYDIRFFNTQEEADEYKSRPGFVEA